MWKVQNMDVQNLREFVPPLWHHQNPNLSPCKGLLRPRRPNTVASVLIGVGAVGVFLAYSYGSTIFVPLSQWFGIPMSASAADYIHCFLNKELTIPGLRNMGNNCFLNVVLQALASSHFFQAFINNCVQMSENLPGKNDEFMPLASAVSVLLQELSVLGREGRVASPRRVMMALEFYATNFDLAKQQDAAEALGHLLSALKEEFLIYSKEYMPHHGSLSGVLALSDSGFSSHKDRGERIYLENWNQCLQRPLDGTLGSVVTCQSCLIQSSTQFEFFYDLPLSPIVDSDGDIIEGCTIHDCLKKFTALERIANYRCNNCSHRSAIQSLSLDFEKNKSIIQKINDCNDDDKCSCKALLAEQGLHWPAVHQIACKQLKIGRCPKVLCIHLQRASVNEVGELIKLTGHVKFSTVLDLFPYTVAAQEVTKGPLLHEMQMQMMKSQLMLSTIKHFKLPCNRNSLPWSPLSAKESSFCAPSTSGNCLERQLSTAFDQLHQPQNKCLNDDRCSMTESITCGKSDCHLQPDDEGRRIQIDCSGVQNGNTKNVSVGFSDMASTSHQDTDDGCCLSAVQHISKTDVQLVKNKNSSKNTNDSNGHLGSSRSLHYELVSVVQHNGSLGNGHYTVYRKVKVSEQISKRSKKDCPEQATFMNLKEETYSQNMNVCATAGDKNFSNSDVIWFRISDSYVERVTEKCVLEAYASLLFYERFEDADS